ncbi:MAG: DUF2630 family protein [Thermoanaerobaculia bacterium]
MTDKPTDPSIRQHIEQLVKAEHKLYEKGTALEDEDRAQLHRLKLELDQCWDLLRQRQALRDAGQNPDQAHVRPVDVVENYEG